MHKPNPMNPYAVACERNGQVRYMYMTARAMFLQMLVNPIIEEDETITFTLGMDWEHGETQYICTPTA